MRAPLLASLVCLVVLSGEQASAYFRDRHASRSVFSNLADIESALANRAFGAQSINIQKERCLPRSTFVTIEVRNTSSNSKGAKEWPGKILLPHLISPFLAKHDEPAGILKFGFVSASLLDLAYRDQEDPVVQRSFLVGKDNALNSSVFPVGGGFAGSFGCRTFIRDGKARIDFANSKTPSAGECPIFVA